MPDSTHTTDFDSLVAHREQLQDFCGKHYESVMLFLAGSSFKVYQNEIIKPGEISLSSTATCYESLLDCPDKFLPKLPDEKQATEERKRLIGEFIAEALKKPLKEWRSGESAEIYCKARTLPIIVRHIDKYDEKIAELLKKVVAQLEGRPIRFSIGEVSSESPDDPYPPNGFHTYWTLSILHEFENRVGSSFPKLEDLELGLDIKRMRLQMVEWARQSAGYQITLHNAGSSVLDSDQLAWALTILLKFDDHFQVSLARQDFIRQGFKCLFEAQIKIGTWRRGSPLFHYRKSGNAYCYVFETFGVLLKASLTNRPEGLFFRQVLKPYASKLLELWKYAVFTKVENGSKYGWSSGHRINHPEPESWATASVFAFSQSLRRLIGIWVRETAADNLKVRETNEASEVVWKTLYDRGNTWPEGGSSVADRLTTFFANPVLQYSPVSPDAKLEPDSQPIGSEQARAAILFGPPGASKTTLSKSVAQAIGWDYVELHASHFVAEGLPNVQRTADKIFKELMQLDRTVILFDEIDELVRAREKEPDAFGRFLTTSMLPKLAELWKGRKVIYFVATNHISFFDLAITRAERFDALISVPPPSIDQKIVRLNELLKTQLSDLESSQLNITAIEADLAAIISFRAKRKKELSDKKDIHEKLEDLAIPETNTLAKLLLIRYDQLAELAHLIENQRANGTPVDLRYLCNKFSDRTLKTCEPYYEYVEGRKYGSHDFGKTMVWRVEPKGGRKKDEEPRWLKVKGEFGEFDSSKYKKINPGVLEEL